MTLYNVFILSHQKQLIAQWEGPRERARDILLVLSSFLRHIPNFKTLIYEMVQITK